MWWFARWLIVAKKDIASYARQMAFPIIPCDLCGSQPNLQRQKVKDMLQVWELEQPGRINNIFRAIANVEPSHLADFDLYDFKGLSQAVTADEDPLFGDIAEKEKKPQLFDIQLADAGNIIFARVDKNESLKDVQQNDAWGQSDTWAALYQL